MNTWKIVARPKNTPTVKNKWVFRIKTNSDGTIDRYKARLVAKGFTQTYGIDYSETFSPVVRFETLRYLFSLAAENCYEIHNMDVKTAFLNGDLEEEIYMELPEGVFDRDKSKVCLLQKSLYGLKQSPRCWNKTFSNYLKVQNFHQSDADPCLFIRKEGSNVQILAIYVDDCFLIGDACSIAQMKQTLTQEFKMHDLGRTNFVLGIEINQTEKSIKISQEKYISELRLPGHSLHQKNQIRC